MLARLGGQGRVALGAMLGAAVAALSCVVLLTARPAGGAEPDEVAAQVMTGVSAAAGQLATPQPVPGAPGAVVLRTTTTTTTTTTSTTTTEPVTPTTTPPSPLVRRTTTTTLATTRPTVTVTVPTSSVRTVPTTTPPPSPPPTRRRCRPWRC